MSARRHRQKDTAFIKIENLVPSLSWKSARLPENWKFKEDQIAAFSINLMPPSQKCYVFKFFNSISFLYTTGYHCRTNLQLLSKPFVLHIVLQQMRFSIRWKGEQLTQILMCPHDLTWKKKKLTTSSLFKLGVSSIPASHSERITIATVSDWKFSSTCFASVVFFPEDICLWLV